MHRYTLSRAIVRGHNVKLTITSANLNHWLPTHVSAVISLCYEHTNNICAYNDSPSSLHSISHLEIRTVCVCFLPNLYHAQIQLQLVTQYCTANVRCDHNDNVPVTSTNMAKCLCRYIFYVYNEVNAGDKIKKNEMGCACGAYG
jgi:hypothetical protein